MGGHDRLSKASGVVRDSNAADATASVHAADQWLFQVTAEP